MSRLAPPSNFPHWDTVDMPSLVNPCLLSRDTQHRTTAGQNTRFGTPIRRVERFLQQPSTGTLSTFCCCKPASLMQYKLAQFRADLLGVVSAVAPLNVDVQPSGRLRLYGGSEHPGKCLRGISPSSPAISSFAGRAKGSSRAMTLPDCKVCFIGLSPKSQCQDTKSRNKPCTSRLQNVLQLAFNKYSRAPAAFRTYSGLVFRQLLS